MLNLNAFIYNNLLMFAIRQIILLSVLICFTTSVYDITNFGAVPNSDTITDQFKNQKAILDAIAAANKSTV